MYDSRMASDAQLGYNKLKLQDTSNVIKVHFFGENPNPDSESKPDFLFLWKNPKEDYKSNESIRDEDSIYQCESGFLGFTTFLFLWERIRKKSMW